MRLCNALIQCSLLISLSLFIFNCYAHEHPNHVDPVSTKYAQSAITVAPLTKPIETVNVQTNDFHQHSDDDHLHDTIDARLQAKHNLRQSVHQHTDDDKHENEEDYINRLNLALEDDRITEHQFQYERPPIVDIVNKTPSQKPTKDEVQQPIYIQNETIYAPNSSVQTPSESRTNEQPSSIEEPKVIEKPNVKKVVPDEIKLSTQVPTNERLPTDPIEQNIVKEDISVVRHEATPATQSHKQEEALDLTKTVTEQISLPTDQQQPSILNSVINQTLSIDNTTDRQATFPTSTVVDEQQQQLIPEVTKTHQASNAEVEQLKTSENLQNASSLDAESNQQQQLASESAGASHLPDLSLEQLKIPNVELNNNLEELIPPKPVTESVHNTVPIDSNALPEQPASVVETPKLTETIPTDVKADDTVGESKKPPSLGRAPSPPSRVIRPPTSRIQQRVQTRQRHAHIKTPPQPQPTSNTETTTVSTIVEEFVEPSVTIPKPEEPHGEMAQQPPVIDQSLNNEIETNNLEQSIEPSVTIPKSEEPHAETAQQPSVIDQNLNNEIETNNPEQSIEPSVIVDLPRQVHVHDPSIIENELKEEIHRNENQNPSLDQQTENNTTTDSFLVNDHSPHLPRILENDEPISSIDSTVTNTPSTIETSTEAISDISPVDSKFEETIHTPSTKSNLSDVILPHQYRQICWRLPKPFEPGLKLIENQTLRFINLLPEFLQTTLLGRIDDREKLLNTVWFISICIMSFLFSLIFLSMGAKRLRQSKHVKEIRARCQQLQQYNNQIELERATFERQNQKLSDEIDELKNLPVRDADEEIFELRERYEQLHADWKTVRSENDALQRDIDHKQGLIQRHEFEMQQQVETVAYLNNEIHRQKDLLEKERETIARVQSNDLSLERFEKLQDTIDGLKSEITQLKQDKFAQADQLQEVQDRANQLDLSNNELTIKMKQLKELLQQRDETIARIREKMLDANDDEEKTSDIGDILSEVAENNSHNTQQQQQQLLSTVDHDVQKANQHMRDLQTEIEDKTRRVKELDALLNQEKDRCRELETKLKVVLELRERDAHLHIRQLGQTDAELRKARTDTERVRILQQQLELKQQQLDDVQKVLGSEQTKFSDECSKLQHEVHEKWMEVKRLTRELESARKECEGLRRQITKYAQNDRSSQEKVVHKPVPQHVNNASRLSSEPETNGSSPPTLPYQQGDNFRPIDHERNDSGAASPAEMLRIRPPLFGLARPPFFPPPFMPPPPPNPFMMAARFPMPMNGLHGMISPIPHLMTNGSGGGSDTNSFEIVDSTNITPNSTSYDAQVNGSAASPPPDGEQQAAAKPKKAKKSLKKRTKTSGTTTVSSTNEDV